jgi:hypothetical protein
VVAHLTKILKIVFAITKIMITFTSSTTNDTNKMTHKEILSANRDSVISSIKFVCKVWKAEDVKAKMIDFLSWMESNITDVDALATSKKLKTELKYFVQKMSISAKREIEESENLRRYGTKNPKLADIMAFGAELHEQAGEEWNPILKDWVKTRK